MTTDAADHYRRADELLRKLDERPGNSINEFDIPDLLLALTHAVLATAPDETVRRTTFPPDFSGYYTGST
jgi:hypothetical protein